MGLLGSISGGLLGMGSSAIQNSQNRQNVRETNQMNYKINQMNNQFNERMAMQQRSWQENMCLFALFKILFLSLFRF
jgi:hypothetical protein